MNLVVKFIAVSFLMLGFVFIASCGKVPVTDERIVGIWGINDTPTLEFTADGKMYFRHSDGERRDERRYKIEGETIIMIKGNKSVPMDGYVFRNGKLIIVMGGANLELEKY